MKKNIKVGFSIKGLYQYFHMIKPIINANIGYEIKFYIFHVNEFYEYKGLQPEITDAITIDLLKTRNIVKKIKELELDYMIIFNPGQIFDVFINAICKELGVKTVYHQHGLSLDFGTFAIKSLSQGKKTGDMFLSLRRYLFFYKQIMVNIFFLREKYFILKILAKRSKQVILMFGSNDYPKYGLEDFHCDLAIVFGKKDKKYLTSKNGFKETEVIIGGYPMVKAEETTNDNGLPKNYILYISSGLLSSKVIPITIQDERVFYTGLAEKVTNIGKMLVVKLHPTENLELFKDYLKDFSNTFVFKDFNLSTLVANADIVIGDYSSALFYPIKHFKPLVLLQSEFFKKYPFDYADYGIGVKVYFPDLEQYLKNAPIVNLENYNDFILEFISNEEGIDSNEILYKKILGM